jgi:hypothetical protein
MSGEFNSLPPSVITLDDAERLRNEPALEFLRGLPRWVPWRWEAKADGDFTKVPFQAGSPELKAASNRSETWGTFEQALDAALRTDAAGIGIVITASRLCALDLDHCIDDNGELAEWAQSIVGMCPGCYCERTPSGHGLRILGWSQSVAKVPRVKLKIDENGACLETFRRATRFLTVTGKLWDPSATAMNNLDPVIDFLQAEALRQEPPRPPRERHESDAEFIDEDRLQAALDHIPADDRDMCGCGSAWPSIRSALAIYGMIGHNSRKSMTIKGSARHGIISARITRTGSRSPRFMRWRKNTAGIRM